MSRRYLASLVVSLAALAPTLGCTQLPGEDQDSSLASFTAATEAAPAITWPTPEGWSAESFPFPLFFAPSLAHRGLEELRFMPGYPDTNAPDYFSYSFVWVLDDSVTFSDGLLAGELTTYFTGLAETFDAAHFNPHLHFARIEHTDGDRYRGRVFTVDPFHDSRRVTLNVEIDVAACGKRTLVGFNVSPRPSGDAVWALLDHQRRTLQCGE